jgi:putative Mg2+ transporter-C (MgtC) family protein
LDISEKIIKKQTKGGPVEQNLVEIFKKILLTIFVSGLIGAEREIRHKGAGLRTHILVGVGSTLIVLTSFYIFDTYKAVTSVDPTRMIAGLITGIGFLCGGTIIRSGNQVTGLTTAASLWTVCGLGMAVGAGQYVTAVLFSTIIVLVLIGARSLEQMLKDTLNKEKGD